MGHIIRHVVGILSIITSVYMMIISVRIILSWFGGIGHGGFLNILTKITDPYLNWFRRFPSLRRGFLDFSPIVALGVLSLVDRALTILARYGTISINVILLIALQIVWGAVSFFLGLLIIIMILRFIGYLANHNAYSPFWSVIDSVSAPLLFRMNRVFYKDRIRSHGTAIIITIVSLVVCYIVLKIAVHFASNLLVKLPV